MSQFDELWNELAAPLLSQQFGDVATCTQPGKEPASITATVWALQISERQGEHGPIRSQTRLIGVPRNAVAAAGGTFLQSPGMDDIWTIEGETYAVDAIVSQTASETVLQLIRIDTNEYTRAGMRRRRN